MQCYLAENINEILSIATTWMDQESIMLSEKNSEKDKYCII